MNFEEKIFFINEQLRAGRKVDDIRKELKISEKTFLKEIKENRYKFSQKLKQYIPNTESNTNKINPVLVEPNTNVLLQDKYNSLQVNTIDYLTDNISILKEIIDKYSNTKLNTKSNTGIVIDLVDDKHLKPKPKAVRINYFIYDEWQKFCDENKYFSKQDLISMALKEYMEKYKK